MEQLLIEELDPATPDDTDRWPNLWQHHKAAQAEARASLLCLRGIARRQAPENRSITSKLSDFHRYWQKRRNAA